MNIKLELDNIRVASPCHARWDDMQGDDRARFCGQCQKHVFNLSAMTRKEITTLIQEKEGRFCGRFYQRADGRMLTANCIVGWRHSRNMLKRICGTAFASLLLLFGVRTVVRAQSTNQVEIEKLGRVSAISTNQPGKVHPRELMGDIAVPPVVMGKISPGHLMGEVFIPPPQPPATNSTPGPVCKRPVGSTNQCQTTPAPAAKSPEHGE
jgi:hypothetical protein